MENNLTLCNQCEQAANGIDCTKADICGKSADTQSLRDKVLIDKFNIRPVGGVDNDLAEVLGLERPHAKISLAGCNLILSLR